MDMTVQQSFKIDLPMYLLENKQAGLKIWIDLNIGEDVILASRGSVEFNKKI